MGLIVGLRYAIAALSHLVHCGIGKWLALRAERKMEYAGVPEVCMRPLFRSPSAAYWSSKEVICKVALRLLECAFGHPFSRLLYRLCTRAACSLLQYSSLATAFVSAQVEK